MGYNMYNNFEVMHIIIYKSKKFLKDYKKILVSKHLYKEIDRLNKIEGLIIESDNLHVLLNNPLRMVYNIEKKSANLKEYYTARLNSKIRLIIKPCSDYPYVNLNNIVELEFLSIDDTHYREG